MQLKCSPDCPVLTVPVPICAVYNTLHNVQCTWPKISPVLEEITQIYMPFLLFLQLWVWYRTCIVYCIAF